MLFSFVKFPPYLPVMPGFLSSFFLFHCHIWLLNAYCKQYLGWFQSPNEKKPWTDVWSSNQFLIHASDVMICYKLCSFLFSKRSDAWFKLFYYYCHYFYFFIVVLQQKHCSWPFKCWKSASRWWWDDICFGKEGVCKGRTLDTWVHCGKSRSRSELNFWICAIIEALLG